MTRHAVCSIALAAVTLGAAQSAERPGPGIPASLARARAAAIRDLRYDLTFLIPPSPSDAVRGRAVLRFALDAPQAVVVDFAPSSGRLHAVTAGGRPVDAQPDDGHIIIPAAFTTAGANDVTFEFDAGDEALNRNDEFLYTLFVPARAHLAFPSFDQPDLKARFTLTLEIPDGWRAVSNGAESERTVLTSGRTRLRFAETPPLPTYLFAFAAGEFLLEEAVRDGRPLRMFHRETDAEKVARNRDLVFDLHSSALTWLIEYTGIPYPFGKFDVVLLPAFQFGGMEHPGAIFYNASRLLLDESATQNQELERASLIAHETSHMWFGDLVTMRWFDDVWMKEVFANFMAARIVNPSFPAVNHDLRFLWSHYPAAYRVDRTAGTNAIRQPLANLAEAGQLYGAIIYQKAPVVMRQLELQLGEAALRDGLREYLSQYAFGNATWLDLVRILDARTPQDLAAWSRAWVEERGRPEFETALALGPDGRIERLAFTVRDPYDRGLVWPQHLTVALGYPGTVIDLALDVSGRPAVLDGARGLERPLFVLPNGGGLGYGLFLLDEASREYLLAHVEDVPDALTRGSAWVTLWDNLLEGLVPPARFFDAALRALPREPDAQNVERLLGYLARTFWAFLTEDDRTVRSARFERILRGGMDRAETASRKAAWFNAYRDTARSAEALAWLTRVWRREETVPGLPLAEPDEITLALELAVRAVPGWADILAQQHARTENPDRKARFAFVMPALSADPVERERAFDRLQLVEHRRREPWALESLHYLNHPLRADHARRFIRPALDGLQEIQQTGDIFFPTRWLESTLWGHSSPEAASTVRGFLADHPSYPERLRWTILGAADELLRAAAVVNAADAGP